MTFSKKVSRKLKKTKTTPPPPRHQKRLPQNRQKHCDPNFPPPFWRYFLGFFCFMSIFLFLVQDSSKNKTQSKDFVYESIHNMNTYNSRTQSQKVCMKVHIISILTKIGPNPKRLCMKVYII